MVIEPSPFDGKFYGIQIGRIVPDDAGDLDATLAAGKAAGYATLFLRVTEGSPLALQLAARGITPVETLVTSTLEPGTPPPVRLYASEPLGEQVPLGYRIEHHDRLEGADVEAIGHLTAETFHGTHLHVDPRLPIDRTRELYAAWARNDVTGRAQRTIVARGDGGEITGYITVVVANRTNIIDLVAVSPAHQGQGIGGGMLRAFLDWHRTTDLAATVGTQSDNPALQLYQRFGFTPTHVQSTYHFWLD